MVTIPNRMRGFFLKFRIKGTDGGKGYKVHSGFFFDSFDNDNKPNVRKVMIKVRPQNSMVDMMVNESCTLLNLNLKNGGSFNYACNAGGKNGFGGVVCNYFKQNMDEVINNPKMPCPDLQLDPHYRLKTTNQKTLEVFDDKQNEL